MAIKGIQTTQVGTGGILPSIAYISTSDTEATVLTAGYLNHSVQNGGVSFTLPCMALVSTQASVSAAPVASWYDVIHSGANWSLTAPTSPGGVTLPTIANHIATYTNTLGNLSEDPATAISGGKIQSGLSTGTIVGEFLAYPTTASKGYLSLQALANATGNFNTTISNATAIAQTQVISIPDGGAAASNFIISNSGGTQTIATGGLALSAGSFVATTGNFQAGSAGHAGTFTSFPGTTGNGTFVIAALNAGGAWTTTLKNSVMAQSTVYSIPDVTAATGNMLAAGAPLVSGNFPKASGTAGAVVDSGISATSVSGAITQVGQLYQVSVTFNTAQMVTAYDTPLSIVANPTASQMILVLQASVYTASTGHTAYATGTAPIIQYSSGGTNGQHGLGTIATAAGLVAGDITAAVSQVRNLFGIATAANTGLSGLGLYFSNATGDYTAGTGTSVTFTVVYQLLTATV